MDTIHHYRIERRPFDPAWYDFYLQMYGSVYGDMSDPVKRAETITALRRRDAMTVAAACRALRQEVADCSTDDLRGQLPGLRYLIEDCKDARPWNVRECDIHRYRMIINELKRRGEI